MTTTITLLLILLLLSLTSSNASSRSNIQKVSPAPSPNIAPVNKELNNISPSETERSIDGNCDGWLQTCRVGLELVACVRPNEIARSKEWVVLVQNGGNDTLNVNVSVPSSVRIDSNMLNLTKQEIQKVNISTGAIAKAFKITLTTGNGACSLEIGPSASNFNWIPAYSPQSTPIYGAYFMFFTIIIVGFIYACCKLRNRERNAGDGIAYQQIEMANQIEATTGFVDEDAGNRWEQNWDDEWDEEEARVGLTITNTPISTNGNGSTNGISSKSPDKKNDWDSDWDD